MRSCHLQFLLHCCFCRVAATPYPAYKAVGPVSEAPPGNDLRT
ncbi:hypothetical protein AC520_3972 [Enterobacter sp. OLF]|nr:hypothetical protein AC520_3972 [Enterobacter sp. OLF]